MKCYSIYHKPGSKAYLIVDNLTRHRSRLLTTEKLIRPNIEINVVITDLPDWIICAEIDNIFELSQLPQTHPELFI